MQRQTLAGAGLVPKQAQNLPPREWARPGSWNRKWSLDTIRVKSGFQQLAKCPRLCMVFKESECGFQVPAPTHTSYLARWHSKTFQKARAGWAALTHRIGAHVPAPPRPSLAEGQPRGGSPHLPRCRASACASGSRTRQGPPARRPFRSPPPTPPRASSTSAPAGLPARRPKRAADYSSQEAARRPALRPRRRRGPRPSARRVRRRARTGRGAGRRAAGGGGAAGGEGREGK